MSAMVMLFQVSETKRNKSSKYHHRTDPTAAVDQAESFDVLHALHHALGRVDVHREVAENVDVDEGACGLPPPRPLWCVATIIQWRRGFCGSNKPTVAVAVGRPLAPRLRQYLGAEPPHVRATHIHFLT